MVSVCRQLILDGIAFPLFSLAAQNVKAHLDSNYSSELRNLQSIFLSIF
jgi:hypothetical protein